MTFDTRGLLLLTTALCAATAASAQDSEPTFLGTLRIEGAAAQSLLGNTEITEQDIEHRNPATVADVFAGESSVTVSGGAAMAQKVMVNGIEESLLSVTIDGARQNKGAFHHTGNVLLDPALLKSVEVSEGLAPADAGPGALAGALAYTTKDARDLLDPGDPFGGTLTFSGGGNGTGLRSNLALFGQQGGLEWLLSGTRQRGDDYRDGDGDTVDGTGAELDDYIVKLAYTTASGKRLAFSASQTEDTGPRASQGGYIRADFGGLTSAARPTEIIGGYARRSSYTLTYTDEAPMGWFAPTAQLTYNEQEVDVGAVSGVNYSLSGTIKNEFQLANGTLTAGLDMFDEGAKATEGTSGSESHRNLGLFVQARQDLTDRVSVSYGARYDYQWFDGVNDADFEDGGFSLNGAVDVVLTDALTLNAGLASTFGGYALGEAALINVRGTDWTYDGFGTSHSNAARIGLRYETGPWAVSGALFQTEITNINAVLPSGGDRGAQADMVSRGFDGSVAYTGTRGFVRLNYTHANVELDDDTISGTSYYLGRPVGSIAALEAGYDIRDNWRIGGTAEIALENDATDPDLPSYEVLDLYTTYHPAALAGLELRLDVKNVFDARYASRSSDGLDSTGSVIPLYEPGRTALVTATMRF
ncbi:TonB-dependent receptor [Salipiger aestuarii]|uniref:Hemoglobin/transferrin/lactoferrin receptor protein n=1 Tax=Salipiger aestuarii TaxID=568098 RepID=A0A327YPE3_9RHOB|nr:TonB-dependent receptor [Salipiger aestuarii]EIE50158.1 TonB-dependent receptor precursor [Citreicella sp. 357]KAA8609994.1 TonB-dependent receptor [Salipiger aestuarii]KAA8616253.1 TonB-dependent receptor [Salipiger aestuarii]KAB2543200.1 TonB-dependent receptor [Salipiger aestuarii]RAK21525.1 hemoglobin/transferrin/lactoferrin receptor protein [Salipiger aestuarii]